MGGVDHRQLGGIRGGETASCHRHRPPGSSVTQDRPASLVVGQGSEGGLLSFPQGIGRFCWEGCPWISDMKWPDLTLDSLASQERSPIVSHADLSRGKTTWKSRGAGVFFCPSFPFQNPPCCRAWTLLLAASLGFPACLFSLVACHCLQHRRPDPLLFLDLVGVGCSCLRAFAHAVTSACHALPLHMGAPESSLRTKLKISTVTEPFSDLPIQRSPRPRSPWKGLADVLFTKVRAFPFVCCCPLLCLAHPQHRDVCPPGERTASPGSQGPEAK